MNENSQLNFLDILTLVSFCLQLKNQRNIISLGDVQNEVNRAISEIHAHLEMQDGKLDKLLEGTYEDN